MTAMFDSRVFTLPKEDVVNYFIWRQQDASRNSIQMVCGAYFSHNELYKKSTKEVHEMGVFSVKETHNLNNDKETIRSRWVTDKDITVFTENRDYVGKYL